MEIDYGNIWIADLMHYTASWNMILFVIFVSSIIGTAIFFERLYYLRKVDLDTNALMIQLRQSIEQGNIIEAIQICDLSKGAVSNILKAGLCRHNKPKDQIEGAMEIRGLIEIAQMEKNARFLSIIANISPLIGLLGTVLGFIQAFSEMRLSGLVDISATRLGEAMEYALVTTAAGLVVAIPASISYNYLVSRIEGMIIEIQATSSEIVDLLINRQEGWDIL